MNSALLSSKKMDWCTPQDFFDRLNEEFGFVLDAAATDKTAKCTLYYTPETDGLSQSWDRGGAVFCNPPYGREIGKWVKKAYEEARGGYAVVLLIPARTDTTYFHDYIYGKAEIRFVRGRLRFTDDDGNASDPAPFPSMVVIYNGERVKMSEKSKYICLLGINPKEVQKCNTSECPTCGWEAAEAERRRAYLHEHGLTLCADGLRRLIIPKNGGNEEMKYKICDHCGAHLDNGETCDCQKDADENKSGEERSANNDRN